jgi:hypothetical protein
MSRGRVLTKTILMLIAALVGAFWLRYNRRRRSLPSQPANELNGGATTLNTSELQYEFTYDLLDRRELKRRMGESFPNVHLTVISIIQGVALGILAQNIFVYISNIGKPGFGTIVGLIPYAFLSFLIIVIVSFEYNWFVGVYRWSPKFLDTFIPFLLGIGEIAPLYSLSNPKAWWLLNAFLTFAGTIAFMNTFINTKIDMFKSEELYRRTKREFTVSILLTAGSALSLPVIALNYNRSPKIYFWHLWEVIAFIIFFIMMVLLIAKDQRFIRHLHHRHELKY